MRVPELVMLARAVSAQHHVKVELAGMDARTMWTDKGAIIQLPMPTGVDYERELYRGYLDHEVGHVRFTDRSVICRESLLHTAWNIFEDVYVEERMGTLYPGCKRNLAWLQEHIFTPAHADEVLDNQDRTWLYLAYLLYVRRGIGHSLDKITDAIGHDMAEFYAVATRPTHSTRENLQAAKDFIALLPPAVLPEKDGPSEDTTRRRECQFSIGVLGKKALIDDQNYARLGGLEVTVVSPVELPLRMPIYPDPCLVAALSRCLPPLIQAVRYKPASVGTKGRLSSRHLYRAAVNDGRVFKIPAKRFDHDVEVMFLVDFSGSMVLNIVRVLEITVSMMVVLEQLPRMTVHVWGFRDDEYFNIKGRRYVDNQGVCGSTPTGGVMFKMASYFGTAPRKILFVLTDGEANLPAAVEDALRLYDALGIEVYAIGLGRDAKLDVFGEGKSAAVENVRTELAPALRDMLKGVLCK